MHYCKWYWCSSDLMDLGPHHPVVRISRCGRGMTRSYAADACDWTIPWTWVRFSVWAWLLYLSSFFFLLSTFYFLFLKDSDDEIHSLRTSKSPHDFIFTSDFLALITNSVSVMFSQWCNSRHRQTFDNSMGALFYSSEVKSREQMKWIRQGTSFSLSTPPIKHILIFHNISRNFVSRQSLLVSRQSSVA